MDDGSFSNALSLSLLLSHTFLFFTFFPQCHRKPQHANIAEQLNRYECHQRKNAITSTGRAVCVRQASWATRKFHFFFFFQIGLSKILFWSSLSRKCRFLNAFPRAKSEWLNERGKFACRRLIGVKMTIEWTMKSLSNAPKRDALSPPPPITPSYLISI